MRLGNWSYTGDGRCRLCGAFFDHQLEHKEICSTADATRGHHACVHTVLGGLRLADAGVTTEPPEDSQRHNPDRLICSLPLLCGIFQCKRQPEGDAARAAFERKTSHYRREILDLRAQGIVYRLPGLDSGRPTTPCSLTDLAVSSRHRVLPQRATNVSISPSAQEIQIAFLRRRAALTRAVLPNTSAREQHFAVNISFNKSYIKNSAYHGN